MAGEWKALRIGDLGRIVTGKTPSTKVKENFGEDLPFVTPSDMDSRKTINETERYLSNSGAGTVKNAVLPAGAVVVSCIGSDMGKAAIAGSECVTNQQINSIIVGDEWCAEYVYYDLSTRKAELQNLASSGSAQPILNKGHFSQIPIVMPPLPEQRAIAYILGSLDDKIELNRRMNETLEALARALFKSWFVDFDPVRAKMEGRQPAGMDDETSALFPDLFEDSALGEIPKGWRAGTFGEVAEHPRRTIKPENIEPSQAYIGLDHMPRKSIALSEWDSAEGLGSNKYEFRLGEILFGKLRPYFHKVGVAPLDGMCSTDILVVAPDEPEWFGFVLGHISSTEFVDYTNASSTGTRMPRTNWKDMSSFALVVPPVEIPRLFTDLVRPLTGRIIANIHESNNLAAIRDTLLPKLLSGEIRMMETEEAMEETV